MNTSAFIKDLYNKIDEQSFYSQDSDFDMQDNNCLTEVDFYPPADNRVWKSNVYDIKGGDNFADYCEYIFEILDEEEYFEN